jgi:predicted secreted protein
MIDKISKVLKSGKTEEDKLEDISEIILAPERIIRREFTKSFRRCAEILSQMMNDYQFDIRHSDYCGFLNTNGSDWDEKDFTFLVANISLFEGFIHRNGFNILNNDFNEFIIEVIKK